MNLQDTPARYGAVSVFNHWLGAALIVALLAIGLYFEDMPRGDEKLYLAAPAHFDRRAGAAAARLPRLLARALGFARAAAATAAACNASPGCSTSSC